jgi:hypothetical protein
MPGRTPLNTRPGAIDSPGKVWACFPCSDIKNHMTPDAWHAFILQTPYWWTTLELFERRRRPTICRCYDSGLIAAATTVIGAVPWRSPIAAAQDPSPNTLIAADGSTPDAGTTETQSKSRAPTLAELEEIFRMNGTSFDELETRVLFLARQCIEEEGRPVPTDDIVAYVNAREPHLLAILELVDQARALARKKGRGKRLTGGQREQVLRMLADGQPVRRIADQLGVTYGTIYRYKTGKVRAA